MRRGTGSSTANAPGSLNASQQQQQQQQQQRYQHQQFQYPQHQQALPPGARPSPSLPAITRSASPSGLSGFFSKPTKWFTRQNSSSKVSPVEPRPSTSSISSSRRRPTISGPTDPRPIEALPPPRADGKLGGGLASLSDRASRSVLDLSRASADLNTTTESVGGGLGDLRSISRKAWSRSMDNLSSGPPPPKLTPLNTSVTMEMKIEQYRSGSPATPRSTGKGYPFPSMPPGTPSTPPSNADSLHQLRKTSSHSHSHSGSGSASSLPIAPGVLSSPSGARLAPPSPKQHGPPRKRSFDFDRAKTRQHSESSANNSGSRSGFSFAFGGPPAMERKGSSPAISPPAIVEPEQSTQEESKRASQIVHRSGFINRLQNFSVSSPQLGSSKNWKPYKLVLKGSKMHFYKPPSDRAAAIKDLFPTGLVSLIEEDAEEEEDTAAKASSTNKDRDDSRRKRAFWGRRTHPDVVTKDGYIERGTLEALVHEAVFGTTFTSRSVEAQEENDWQSFASTVLLTLPYLVEREKFEFEFHRCSSYLVSGADEADQDAERERVEWLAQRYIAYHGSPADEDSWKSFCKDVIPNFKPDNAPFPAPSMPPPPQISIDSPDMGTFSPRPPQIENKPAIASAVHLHTPSSRPDPSSPARSMRSPGAARTRVWAALEQEGFTREVFMKLEVDSVARSLLLFHKSCLDVPPEVVAEALLNDSSDAPLVQLFGTDDSPHWLTRTIIVQILGPGHIPGRRDGLSSSSGSAQGHRNGGGGGDERTSASSSRTHIRSEVIGRWARVGELCRHAGDETSWRAVMAALCSTPIARLEKAWKRVESGALAAVRTWVYAAPHGARAAVPDPRRTPWGGQSRQGALALIAALREAKGGVWPLEKMKEVRAVYVAFQSALAGCAREQHRRDVSEDEDVARLVLLWKESARKAPKTLRIDQYMSLSFAAEQKRKGLYAPYYWSRTSNHGLQALAPLIFPEPLPYVSLIDRSHIIRSKKTSVESGIVFNDAQAARLLELKRTIEPNGVIRASGAIKSGPRGNTFDLGGMILPVFDGELLLSVVSGSDAPSRPASTAEHAGDATPPPSRAPSIRVKSAAAGLDRKSSRLRRSSLPSLSARAPVVESEQTDDRPLRALIQAGTLDALVHFLIHGLEGVSVSVADDNGEMALRDKKTKSVKVDRAEFASVWWNVFRSFVSPYVLFQLLRKEYLSACPPSGSTSSDDYLKVVHTRMAVIRVLGEWVHVGGGAQDALDDPELHSAITTFLSQHEEQTHPPQEADSEHLAQLRKDLESGKASLRETFTAQTMRPQTKYVPVRGSVSTAQNINFGSRPPRLDELMPEELVNNLDAMASAAFRNVVQEDLFVTADLLEVQTADRTGWFLPREPSSSSEDVEVQTMYTFFMEIESSPLIGELSGDILYRLLPPGIRSLIRAYNILRKWAICNIAAPQIGAKARQARMETFLKAIEICRLRNADDQTVISDANPAERPCVRSFVEAVLTSAVVSPESRLFTRAWQAVATARGAQVESLLSLISTRTVHTTESQEKLTVDPAWLVERMLEVISLADVLDSLMETPLSLVNFDKRRQLCNIITNSPSFASRGSRQRRELDRSDFERLNRIEQDFADLPLDMRMLKDDAHREAMTMGPSSTPSGKRAIRPFQRSVLTQQEKTKRDRYLRERLLKEKRQEQQRMERKEDDLNRMMDPRGGSGTPHKQHRSKRSMSALFSLMRPISTAFSSESTGVAPRRGPADLDFKPTQKPAFVLSLVDARVAGFINNEKSFTFQLDTEDGGHYLFQALSRNDMNQWIKAISTSVQSYAQRRLTYIGDASQLQFTDHMQPRPAAAQEPGAVFGVDLDTILKREAYGEDVSPDAVPRVLELLLTEIETRGLTEQGIYRVAGATSEVTALREALNKGQMTIDPMSDINAVCGVVKYWFRVLPETVIPEVFFDQIVEAARLPDLDERLAKIREVVHLLPRSHYSVLKRFAEHLDKVVDYEEKNHMTPDNLATVICPNLLRAPNNSFGLIMQNMGPITVLFKALITHVHFIFDEDDGEEEDDHADGEAGPLSEDLIPTETGGEDGFISDPRFTSSPEPEESPLPDIVLQPSTQDI